MKLSRLLFITAAWILLVTGDWILVTSSYADITDGLIGHWRLDEGSGAVAADSSGSNYNGTIAGEPAWALGRNGNALIFNGIDNEVDIGDIEAFEFGPDGSFSIALWFMPVLNQSAYLIGKLTTSYWHSIPS